MVKSLGIELSTQTAKIIVLDSEKGVVYRTSIDYDSRFPKYRTKKGVLHSDNKEKKHTSPKMLVEVIDECFEQMERDNVNLSDVGAIKLDGMQHCTVYANGNLERVLKRIREYDCEDGSLIEYFNRFPSFSRATAPIWEDRTTEKQCAELTQILEPLGGIINLTGNKAEMRFPAAQIMKFVEEDPNGYEKTRHIQILSAFATSILAGRTAPVDMGDGWGSNLNTLDIISPSFDVRISGAIDRWIVEKSGVQQGLYEKLGQMTHYDAAVGRVANYFVEKYGVNPNAVVLAGTGDNPATLLGAGGGLVLSLGSSYTLNGMQSKVMPSNGEDNVFGFIPGKSMSLVCFTNGGKLHEEFLRRYLKISKKKLTTQEWADYEAFAERGSRNEHLMLPYQFAESVPVAPVGVVRDGFDDENAVINIAALYLSQMAAVRNHSRHMQIPSEICMVGGAGESIIARRITANMFNRKTYNIKDSKFAAPLGCAIAAMRYALGISYEEAIERFVQKEPKSVISPTEQEVERMKGVTKRYEQLEKDYLQSIRK